ncbi:MAG TPA: hypothetical protein ENG83_00150 [Nitrospirae bacterium]|nr:hypothetical protein BMS3Abin06_02753 [bacterium BMS3Abin06]HDH10615.1 hypothetical protein [Nitrospirota bacterium]HDZ00261.1 hypothetical protein [Nitrospirota bacterium]
MVESVFKELLQQNLITDIHVIETLPNKGKPAQKIAGSTTVWIIKFYYGDSQSSLLEAARGGPREWASLDSLSNLLRVCGVEKYQVHFSPERDRVPQESFEFANTI